MSKLAQKVLQRDPSALDLRSWDPESPVPSRDAIDLRNLTNRVSDEASQSVDFFEVIPTASFAQEHTTTVQQPAGRSRLCELFDRFRD